MTEYPIESQIEDAHQKIEEAQAKGHSKERVAELKTVRRALSDQKRRNDRRS